MISLNKPKIYYKVLDDKIGSSQRILKSLFSDVNVNIVFSARQGLDLIYKNIFEKYGSCRVAVTPLTCFEALYPIIHNNHLIEFVDIDSHTFNMNENLIPFDINVIQAIHFGGNPQNMSIIKEKSDMSSAIIIEDCAQAFGSTFNNILLGNFGDYSAFSLSKNLYALAGGFILSNENFDISTFEKASLKLTMYKSLKRFLESKNTVKTPLLEFVFMNLLRLKPESTSYIFSKYTINEKILNSIRKQLSFHEELIEERKKVAHFLRNKINNKNLIEQKIVDYGDSNYTRLLYKLREGDSREYITKLRKRSIWANHLSQNTLSNYQPDVFQISEFNKFAEKADLKNYIDLHNKIISIPVSPVLTKKEMDHIIHQMNIL